MDRLVGPNGNGSRSGACVCVGVILDKGHADVLFEFQCVGHRTDPFLLVLLRIGDCFRLATERLLLRRKDPCAACAGLRPEVAEIIGAGDGRE